MIALQGDRSLREVPTLLLMRLAFGAGLCRFGMFKATRANAVKSETTEDEIAQVQ